MKSIAIISLDCETGKVFRYLRVEGNKPERTGDAHFQRWDAADMSVDWSKVWDFLQAFRIGYVPPEDPAPRPTSPMRTPKMSRAA